MFRQDCHSEVWQHLQPGGRVPPQRYVDLSAEWTCTLHADDAYSGTSATGTAFFLSCKSDDILQKLKWHQFVLLDEHVFTADKRVDIGRNIRQICLGDLDTEISHDSSDLSYSAYRKNLQHPKYLKLRPCRRSEHRLVSYGLFSL